MTDDGATHALQPVFPHESRTDMAATETAEEELDSWQCKRIRM
jgi:hypothetical protein